MFNIFKRKPSKEATAANMASQVLSIQLALGGSDLPAISAAHDRVALGYVFGFHDALCQAMKIPGSSFQGFAVLKASFSQLAGTAGQRILDECIALQSDPEFLKGMKVGGAEAYLLLREKKPALGLSIHLQRRENAP